MTCGIYEIRNKVNGKMYVGQSININIRYYNHLLNLRKNKHYNQHLQRSFCKYGEQQFELVLLEECELPNLGVKEQEWINKHNRYDLYNQVFDVQFRQGESNPFYGKSHTEKAKMAMSAFKKQAYIGNGNPNFGKKHSNETRIKISEGRSRKLTKTIVQKIVIELLKKQSHQNIADLFGIGRTTVTRISNGTRWTNVTNGPVVSVVYSDGVRQFNEEHKKRIGYKRLGQKHTDKTKALMRQKAYLRQSKEG